MFFPGGCRTAWAAALDATMSNATDEHPIELAGFEVERRLGVGGMAEVFLAKKRGAQGTFKQLVVKRILPEHSQSRRFRHMFIEEAQLATRLNHPNIVQIYEFLDHGESGLLLSMEYVEGVDLGQLLAALRKQNRTVPPWLAAGIIAEVAKGLHYAHERRDEGGLPLAIVHRDVSPQNILVSTDGVVKIADFGIATANLFRQEAGVLKGKVGYMSPEQARAEKVDRRSDIYALGVVLYELLSGQSPYGRFKDTALTQAVRQGAIRSLASLGANVPEALQEIVSRATASAADDRFATAREMSAAIARALLGEQQLVDHVAIEQLIVDVLGEDAARIPTSVEAQATLAAVRRARSASSDQGARGYPMRRVVREVRHVAVITLRLDGFDALREVQGEEVARRAIASAQSTLDDIAYKHGAVWSWTSEGVANAVAGLTENPGRAPNDAATIAIDVHDFLSSHSEDLPVPLRASVGLVRGIAAGERDEHGHLVRHELHSPAPYLAHQLAEHTPFGETWVAGGVYRLVRREFRWSDGPAIQLRGAEQHRVPERMRVYMLLRPLTGEERMMELALNPTDLVGRGAEIADLHAGYHRAVYHPGLSTLPPTLSEREGAQVRRSVRGELLARVIVGEMGIGKTALVETFLSELPEDTKVYRVEASPVKIDLPYATVTDLLRVALDVDADANFEQAREATHVVMDAAYKPRHIRRIVSALAGLLIGRTVQHEDEAAAAEHHESIVMGVRLLFGAIARDLPVVIVIDGLQWADQASLEILKRVLDREEALPVLTLLVTRPDDRVAACIEGLMRNELGGLTHAQQARLLQARLGVREGVAEVCRELVPRVGGNPFFLLEMVDALLEKGAIEIIDEIDGDGRLLRHPERWDEQIDELPSTIEQLVGDRLNELPSAEHDVLAWLAVAGGPLSESDILALTRLADDEAISRLCARGLCDKRGVSLDFRHPLARDVAYQALDAVQRARMHRSLGDHFATTPLATGLSAAIIAQHYDRGESPQNAADYFAVAGGAARRGHQTRLALRYFHRMLELLPAADRRRLVAHEGLDRIYRHLGRADERREHLDALCRLAVESRHARWLAVALVHTAQLHVDEGALARGLPAAQRGADMARFARQPDVEVNALILWCELLRDLGDLDGALRTCDRGLEVASAPTVSPRSRAEVLRAKGVLLRRTGQLDAAVQTHAEAIAIFRRVGARRSEARARNALGFALFALGRFEDSIAMCLSSIEIDVRIGGRYQIAKTLANVGMAYARLGATEHGLRYLLRAREAHERYNDHDAQMDTALVTATVLLELGEIDKALDHLEAARRVPGEGAAVYDKVHVHVVTALCALAQERFDDAAEQAKEARQLAEEQGLVSYRVYARAIEANAHARLGRDEQAYELATAALTTIEKMDGSEYGVEVRALCCGAIRHREQSHGEEQADLRAEAQADLRAEAQARARSYINSVMKHIRKPEHRTSFRARPPVCEILAPADHQASDSP
jgi:tetratricopeptide (TPR) repeat protein/tRNA A-37 threonylcarbamoyl transferase component Bud32